MKIAVIDDYLDVFRKVESFPLLANHEIVLYNDTERDPTKLAERLKDADAVVLTQQRSSFPRAVVEQLSKLRLIVQTGFHTDHIDITACTEKGIAVVSSGGQTATESMRSQSTVELTWGLILASVRNIPHEVEQLKRGTWQTTIGTELHGKILGIYALGKIGSYVARIGKAFGMKVICWGRDASRAKAHELGHEVPESREMFFKSADVISLHIKLNKETLGIITAADLGCMKPTALIVNTSRALLIEPNALVEALKNGRPGFAAVDVFEDEPVVGGNHPLLKMPNAICTPHLGYAVRNKYEDFYCSAIDSILGFVTGRRVNVLNPKALECHPCP